MPNRMTSFVPAVLGIVLAAICSTTQPSRAEPAADECIARPNAAASKGSHWYYRVDRTTQRHCWYLGPEGAKVRASEVASPKRQPSLRRIVTIAAPPAAAAEAMPAGAAIAETAARENDPAAAFGTRWSGFPNSDVSVGREPAEIRNSYADERSTDSLDGMPLIWPVLTPADVAAGERPPATTIKPAHTLAFLAGVLVLGGVIARMMFMRFLARRSARRRHNQWRGALHAAQRGRLVPPAFADRIAAARQADIVPSYRSY